MKNQTKMSNQTKMNLVRIILALVLFFNTGILKAQSADSANYKISYKGTASYTIDEKIVPLKPLLSPANHKMWGNFTITPALPAGLLINSSTGIISGTPTVKSTITNYQICCSHPQNNLKSCFNISIGVHMRMAKTSGTQGG